MLNLVTLGSGVFCLVAFMVFDVGATAVYRRRDEEESISATRDRGRSERVAPTQPFVAAS